MSLLDKENLLYFFERIYHLVGKENTLTVGVGDGYAMLAWHCWGAYEMSGDLKWKVRSIESLEKSLAALGNSKLNTSLYASAPGVGWTLAKLGPLLEIPQYESNLAEIGKVYQSALEAAKNPKFDLIVGLAGLLVFASGLAAEQRNSLTEVIFAHLQKVREPGFQWISPFSETTEGANLGIAHGVPGMIAALCAARASGWDSRMCDAALSDAESWLWDQKRTFVDGDGWPYNSGEHQPRSRLAWCYGSASVAISYAWLKKERAHLQPRFDEIAAICVAERNLPSHGIEDLSLCHGNAGWAYMAQRFSEVCSDKKTVLALTNSRDSELLICRPAIEVESDEAWMKLAPKARGEALSLLCGATGLALAVSGIENKACREWQGLLLLDF